MQTARIMNDPSDTRIDAIGTPAWPSPLPLNDRPGDGVGNFVPDGARVRYNAEIDAENGEPELLFEKAGPRARIHFDPARTTAAIVTCGGLCPGLNNVIRSAFLELHHNYGVRRVLGIRYGYLGMNPALGEEPVELTTASVDHIHREGGSVLGSSRGNQPVGVMVDMLQRHGVNILLTVGGDGTQRGANEIAQEARRRGLDLVVVGIPKTIDNDIMYVSRTFGFTTAVDRAREVLSAAHCEAKGYPNGVAIVRVMGRDSGYIAAGATLASQEVNFTLIPEVPFGLDGPNGFLAVLAARLKRRGHALIVVAEGAGQDLLEGAGARDASGNLLHQDIGVFLRDRVAAHFKQAGNPVSMKYLDPSYYIRSVPANSEDALLCDLYARHAVHAAMSGRTGLLIGLKNSFLHIPLSLVAGRRQRVSPESQLWRNVLAVTGQPHRML